MGSSMTVAEARKILGKDGDKYSNEELERIIQDLEILASLTIKAIMKGEIKTEDLR